MPEKKGEVFTSWKQIRGYCELPERQDIALQAYLIARQPMEDSIIKSEITPTHRTEPFINVPLCRSIPA